MPSLLPRLVHLAALGAQAWKSQHLGRHPHARGFGLYRVDYGQGYSLSHASLDYLAEELERRSVTPGQIERVRVFAPRIS